MKNALVVLNIGDRLCANARSSLQAACTRWGCLFLEITENMVGDQDLCFNKVVGIRKYHETLGLDWVMYVDSDILIRSDAPSPFQVFINVLKVHAARDAYDFWSPERLMCHRVGVSDDWLREVHSRLRWDVDIERLVQTSPEWFFNAGMFILQPKYLTAEIDAFISNIPPKKVNSRFEQALWNYILKIHNKTLLVDQAWNSERLQYLRCKSHLLGSVV